jgi:hypothetical protein
MSQVRYPPNHTSVTQQMLDVLALLLDVRRKEELYLLGVGDTGILGRCAIRKSSVVGSALSTMSRQVDSLLLSDLVLKPPYQLGSRH